MKRRVIILVTFIFSALLSFGQDSDNYDTLRVLCEGPIFTLCEKMPRLKYGVPAFEDSLKQYLNNINELPKTGKVALTLAVLRSGEIRYVLLKEGNIEKLNVIVEAIKRLSYHWEPGIQNGHIVCCYRHIELEFSEDKVVVKILGRL